MSANPVTDDIERRAIQEISYEQRWSVDMLAYELGSDPITIRRWFKGYAPENREQKERQDRVESNATAFLARWTPPKPSKRETRPQMARLLHRGLTNFCPHGHEYDEANTGYQPSGRRYCKACRTQRRAAS